MITIIYTLIFIGSLAAGGMVAWLYHFTLLHTLVSLTVAGFIGSSIIALLFTFFFFFRKETDREKVVRLEQEILQLKQQSRAKQRGLEPPRAARHRVKRIGQ